jgi:hypothetical protein
MRPVANRLASYGLVLLGLFGIGYALGERLPGHHHGPVVSAGYSLVLDDHTSSSISFHIADERSTLTDFMVHHGAAMHVALIRDDLSGFQHVHPTMAPDGAWTVAVDLSKPGRWRVTADSMPTGASGNVVVVTDITVPGDATPEPLPPPNDTVATEGLMVTRDGLRFTITAEDGSAATGLDSYLGQSAHLVAFRQGDLQYTHLHPSNDDIGDYRFDGSLPGPGTYRLFLQVTHNGAVLTVPFTVVQT